MDLRLVCTTDCTACCRYREFLPSEIADADCPLGLRVSLLPIPNGMTKWSLRRKLEAVLPVIDDYFLDIRIVDAGYYSLFHQKCSYHTPRKAHCLGEPTIICQARPFEIHLPETMQVQVIDLAKKAYGCGGLSETLGTCIAQTNLTGITLYGKRGLAYRKARKEREQCLPVYQEIADAVYALYFGEWNGFVSEIGRNIFRLLPITILLQAFYETGKSLTDICQLLDQQIIYVEKDIQKFLQEFGQKRVFPEISKADGEKIHLQRGQYLGRMRKWFADYMVTQKHLEELCVSETVHS